MVATNGQLLKEKTQEIPPKPIPLVVIPENIPEDTEAAAELGLLDVRAA